VHFAHFAACCRTLFRRLGDVCSQPALCGLWPEAACGLLLPVASLLLPWENRRAGYSCSPGCRADVGGAAKQQARKLTLQKMQSKICPLDYSGFSCVFPLPHSPCRRRSERHGRRLHSCERDRGRGTVAHAGWNTRGVPLVPRQGAASPPRLTAHGNPRTHAVAHIDPVIVHRSGGFQNRSKKGQ
jgi:hypothetical protein